MPLHGNYRKTLADRILTYAEGRTGDGAPNQGTVDERLKLVLQVENDVGDWITVLDAIPVPFAFDGNGEAYESSDAGDETITEMAVLTREALSISSCYSWNAHKWTVESGSSTAGGSSAYSFLYVLHRHV